MAKNKRPQERQEKLDEIVATARQLFIEEGFESTSMSRLAAAAGIAPNTIYWYFKDKDEVLATVLTEVLQAQWLAYLTAVLPKPIDKLLWLVARLQESSKLITTVHSRLQSSPAINLWHDNFHRMGEALLRSELQAHEIAEGDIGALATVLVFVIEGLLVHEHSTEEKRHICETLLRQFGIS